MRSKIRLLIAFVCLPFAGCGGGGSGGAGGGSEQLPDFALSTSQLSFSSVQNGSAPAAQSFNVTATGGTFGTITGEIEISASISGSAAGSAEIVNCSGSSCQVTVSPDSRLPTGSYSATVTISACTNLQCASPVGQPKTVAVTYVVSAGPQLSSPASLVFISPIGTASAAQNLTLQSSVDGTAWTATVTYETGTAGWLNVPSSGHGTTTLSIQPAGVALGSYRARVDFVPTGGGSPTSTEVLLSARDRAVRFVSPYVAPANSSAEVTIRGLGFSDLSSPVVTFGATAATGVQVVSDSEIRVHNPALPVGQYTVSVSSGGQTMMGTPTFVVVAPPAFTYAALARTSSNPNGLAFGRVVYDAERQTIYVLENSQFTPRADSIERYRLVNGSWVVDSINFPLPGPDIGAFDTYSSITLTPDGKQLIKSNVSSISHIDAASFVVTATVDGTAVLGANSSLLTGAMSNDGGFIEMAVLGGQGQGIVRYDSVERAFYPLAVPAGFAALFQCLVIPTPEGEQVNLYNQGGVPQNIYSYDAGSGSVSKSDVYVTSQTRFVSYSRDGTRTLLQTSDSAVVLNVPSILPNVAIDTYPFTQRMDAAVLSPDGTRLHFYDGSTGILHTLDVHTPPPSGGAFPEVGSGVPVADDPGIGPTMVITPDGGNLILAGTTHLIILPAP